MTTLRDIALEAGVSAMTVSNVVNGFAYVAEETRARVQSALDELGYQVNPVARNLRRGRSGLLALVAPLNVPYFTELARYIAEEAARHSYAVVLDRTDGNVDRERELIAPAGRALLFDGMIFNPLQIDAAELARLADATPLVLLGERRVGGEFDHVLIDDVAAARAATEHLLGIGRRRIAVIGHQTGEEYQTAHHRTEGYRQALQAAHVPLDPALIVSVPRFYRRYGAEAMAALLELPEPPDAVFCYNDLLALGAVRTLLSRGLRVPEDVAVVGFDDSEDGQYSTPTLTTIAQDKRQIARLAIDLLVGRMSGDRSGPTTCTARWQLVPRESTIGRQTS